MSAIWIARGLGRFKIWKRQRQKTIGQLIDESLAFYGTTSCEQAQNLVLVTGDKLLLHDSAMATRVITPQALISTGLH